MALPEHSFEHDALMQLLMQACLNTKSVDEIILVTIDSEGRPCVSSTFGDPLITSAVFRQLGAAEGEITGVTHHELTEIKS